MTVETQSNKPAGVTAFPEPVSLGQQSAADSKAIRRRSHLPILLLIGVLGASAVLYLFTMGPAAFGFYHDEGIYVSTAKGLATGQGYRIIDLPGEPAETKYPPFYPFLLSLIWRIYPSFPGNIVPMMLLSIAATIGYFALTYSYLTSQGYAGRWQALVVVGLAAINWRTLIPATGVSSEMVFALLSVGAMYLAEKPPERSWLQQCAASVMLGRR